MMVPIALAGLLAAYCMVANRLASTILTAPMIFIATGYLASSAGFMPPLVSERALHLVAEIALVILLFLDAAQVDATTLGRRHIWPARMLLIGLPLAFVLGWGAGLILMPELSLLTAGLAAAILMPTDAALGQPVVSNPEVPERPRRALIVESGLNDGLALPVVLLMSALVAPHGMAPPEGWTLFALKQVTLGPLAGGLCGLVAGYVLLWAKRTEATSEVYEGIGALAVACMCYLMAVQIGGNGFIAAFAGGLTFGMIVKGRCAFVFEFTEGEGQLLSWAAFFLIGAIMVPEAIMHLTWPAAALILASLFLVRPIAIWLSLIGTDAAPATRLFFGWFGPRGLATALFALLVVEEIDRDTSETIIHLATNAVWISALLHGITAAPGARLYARYLAHSRPEAEAQPVPPQKASPKEPAA
ncbi:MAG: cation:proton antiporter [Pseudomonadota bacterium]